MDDCPETDPKSLSDIFLELRALKEEFRLLCNLVAQARNAAFGAEIAAERARDVVLS